MSSNEFPWGREGGVDVVWMLMRCIEILLQR